MARKATAMRARAHRVDIKSWHARAPPSSTQFAGQRAGLRVADAHLSSPGRRRTRLRGAQALRSPCASATAKGTPEHRAAQRDPTHSLDPMRPMHGTPLVVATPRAEPPAAPRAPSACKEWARHESTFRPCESGTHSSLQADQCRCISSGDPRIKC